MPDTTEPLPLDFHEWRRWWEQFEGAHRGTLGAPCRCTWPRPSIMTDAVLGRWHIGRHCVELSDVTFDVGGHARMVGVAYRATDTTTEPGPLCRTLAELEAALCATPDL